MLYYHGEHCKFVFLTISTHTKVQCVYYAFIVFSEFSRFHLLAFSGSLRSIIVGCTYALPLCVTFPPKPDELLRNIQVKNGITILVTVPSLLEQLIRELLSEKNNNIGLKPLQKLKFVMYGGAGCPDELCRTLVDNGVVLLSVYGATGELVFIVF
jgi:acyl-CoA synthetase (AMP-forming)/AMP-acid ligase II